MEGVVGIEYDDRYIYIAVSFYRNNVYIKLFLEAWTHILDHFHDIYKVFWNHTTQLLGA